MHEATRAQRIARTVDAHFRAALLIDSALRTAVAAPATRWILAQSGRITADRAGRLRLAPEAGEELAQVGRTLRWMGDPKHHHGQQAAEAAAKTLRAVHASRLDFAALSARCAEFRRVRQGHIVGNAANRPRAAAAELTLPNGVTARRVVTIRDLDRLGRAARNCLADPYFAPGYRQMLRRGRGEFWRFDDAAGAPLCVLQVDARRPALREAAGAGNAPLCPSLRPALLAFLAERGLDVGDAEDALARLGLCDELVAASRSRSVRRFRATLDGGPWHVELAPGVLVARSASTAGHMWLLRSAGAEPGAETAVFQSAGPPAAEGEGEDRDRPKSGRAYLCEAAARLDLRRACRRDRFLADACRGAFGDAPAVFCADWFGFAGRAA